MKIHQTSKQISERRWEWAISLDASEKVLDSIEKVVYHLHHTFREPVVEKINRSEKFELKTSGWGTFTVRIVIHYKNDEVEELRHRLKFEHEKSKVFISYSSSQVDSTIIDAIKQKASQLDWDVSTADIINPGDDLSSALNKQIDEAQLVVMVGGGTPSRSVMEEVEIAHHLGKRVLVYDADNSYGITHNKVVTNSDDLLNEFKAYDFEIKGV
jgi:transcription initiation factor IIF auxiliary subunit